MNEPTILDALQINLQGKHLIEASAGTGKTFTITILYIRLLLMGKKSVREILVVTFTDAAAAELRERIYNVIVEAKTFFETGEPSTKFEFLSYLYEKIEDKKEALHNSKQALLLFDEASIYTIHGFCHKILQEQAFACKEFFQITLQENISLPLEQAVSDFWTKEGYTLSETQRRLLKQNGETTISLLKLITTYKQHHKLCLVGTQGDDEAIVLFDQLEKQKQQLKNIWLHDKQTIRDCFFSDQLRKSKYKESWFIEVQEYIENSVTSLPIPEKLDKFTQEAIDKTVNKNKVAPTHDFFSQVSSFFQVYEKLNLAAFAWQTKYREKFISFVEKYLEKYKETEKIWFFDDLLVKVEQAISLQDTSLLSILQTEYTVGLIDEFQDTDKVQYSIFKQIFQKTTQGLFLIGDPKQAIYGFRGADIFTYLDVKQEPNLVLYTMNTNWRSDATLLDGINHLFLQSANPFVLESIDYYKVQAGQNEQPVQAEETKITPVNFRIFDKANEIPKNIELDSLVEDIQSLVSSHIQIGNKKQIELHDIAVLVRSKTQMLKVKEALINASIPAVTYAEQSVFDTIEADFMLLFLETIGQAKQSRSLFALLAHPILYDVVKKHSKIQVDSVLQALTNQEIREQWQIYWQDLLLDLQGLWRKQGFLSMFQVFLQRTNLLPILLANPEGERYVTNLLHLKEILYTQSRKKQGERELVTWLRLRCNQKETKDYELRVPTDEKAVQIYTIHKSKGLEFPVVFVPFANVVLQGNNKEVVFYNQETKQRTLRIDKNINKIEEEYQEQEKLAEDRRILYVALTRAKHYLYIYCLCPKTNPKKESAFSSLFSFNRKTERLPEVLQSLCEEKSDLFSFTPSLATINMEKQKEELIEIMPEKQIETKSRIWQTTTSYSRLIRNKISSFDEVESNVTIMEKGFLPTESTKETIFLANLPIGVKSGLFFHSVLEEINLQETASSQTTIIDPITEQYDIESSIKETVYQFLDSFLQTKLTPLPFALADIKKEKKEMAFTFSVCLQKENTQQTLTAKQVASYFTSIPQVKQYQQSLLQLMFEPIQGFLEGFIDYVCEFEGKYYVIDYKTNFLGNTYQDYSYPKLCESMKEHHYYLQAYVYTVALHKWLSLTLPEYNYNQHFGGFAYLFLRGIAQGKDTGVFFHCPEEEEIQDFSNYLHIN